MHFLENKVWGNAGALFLMTFPLCVSGSHLGNSHNVSNLFLIITIVMVILSLVTFDVTIVIALGCHLTCPCKITKLTDKRHVCSDCSTDCSSSSLFLWVAGSLRHNDIEIRPVNNPTMASKCPNGRNSCIYLTKSKPRNN